MSVLLQNARVYDGVEPELQELDVLVEQDRIVDVGPPGLAASEARRIDLAGLTLMPGLIDAHVHAYFPELDWAAGDRLPITMVAHWARRMLEGCLGRGFTSVRDTGGADHGLHMALERGWINGPRLFYCGKALSQTGGHGDVRRPHEADLCNCGAYSGHVSRVVDGVTEMRVAIREELRQGAHFIKVMASGGVFSSGDSLDSAQYADDELLAAIDETRRHGTYVTAHVHPDEAMRRAIELGVPCIEHGTLVTAPTAALAAERGTAVVPTLAINWASTREDTDLSFSPEVKEKAVAVQARALGAVELLHRAGARVGFGTDLVGPLDHLQTTEFEIRREVLDCADVLRSATSVNAEIIGQGEHLGRVTPGYLADLIVVDGNPLTDLSVFDETGSNLRLIMKGGEIVVDKLS